MADQCQDTLRCRPEDLRQAMSIHTRKITDSCRDKDCIEDLRVYLTASSQAILEAAANVRVRCAELLYTGMDVEPVAFDRTHYCIDATFYYRIIADCIMGSGRPATLCGLSVFSKRAVLCGEDSHAHVYRSDFLADGAEGKSMLTANRPTAVVEVLDPMVLSCRVKDVCDCRCCDDPGVMIPRCICELFDEDLVQCSERRRLYVSLGQFSIIRLERDAQVVVPMLSYSIPMKDCSDSGGCTEDPCEMFAKIPFPTGQFSPRSCDCQNDCPPKPCRTC